MAQKALDLGMSISTDNESGEVLAVYFRFRKGKAAATKEFGNGLAYADFDKNGKLLGVELLGPCKITILDRITQGEPRSVKNFVRNSLPRQMAIA